MIFPPKIFANEKRGTREVHIDYAPNLHFPMCDDTKAVERLELKRGRTGKKCEREKKYTTKQRNAHTHIRRRRGLKIELQQFHPLVIHNA